MSDDAELGIRTQLGISVLLGDYYASERKQIRNKNHI